MKRLLSLLAFTLSLAPIMGQAAEDLPMFAVEGNNPPPFVDRMHSGLGNKLDNYAKYFDSFFGDERADEESATTEIRIIGSVDYHEINGIEHTPRIRARLNLPRLERKVNLIIDSESDDTSTLADQTSPGSSRNLEKKDETTVALQLVQKSTTDFGISHRVGLSITDGQLNPKLRSQVRFTLQTSERDLFRFTQSVFWEKVDGFGQESRFDYEHLLHSRLINSSSLFRATIRGLSSESSDGYEWSLPIEVLNSLPDHRAYSYGGGISGVTESDSGITNSWIFFRYRQSFLRDWLFFDITPKVEWPKSLGRNTTTMINLALEIVF